MYVYEHLLRLSSLRDIGSCSIAEGPVPTRDCSAECLALSRHQNFADFIVTRHTYILSLLFVKLYSVICMRFVQMINLSWNPAISTA